MAVFTEVIFDNELDLFFQTKMHMTLHQTERVRFISEPEHVCFV